MACQREPAFGEIWALVHNEAVLEERLGRLAHQVSDANLQQLPEFHQRVEVLRRLEYVAPDDTVLMKVPRLPLVYKCFKLGWSCDTILSNHIDLCPTAFVISFKNLNSFSGIVGHSYGQAVPSSADEEGKEAKKPLNQTLVLFFGGTCTVTHALPVVDDISPLSFWLKLFPHKHTCLPFSLFMF